MDRGWVMSSQAPWSPHCHQVLASALLSLCELKTQSREMVLDAERTPKRTLLQTWCEAMNEVERRLSVDSGELIGR